MMMCGFADVLSDGRLGVKKVKALAASVEASPDMFDVLYGLAFSEDERVSWHALWVCEHLCDNCPELFLDKRNELSELVISCGHDGKRRILLNILLALPVDEVRVGLLNFCFDNMLSPARSIAVQANCMKLALKLCEKEPELLPELKCIVESCEPSFYSKGVQSVIKATRKRLGKKR
ncbi:MAG: hypothetical protein J6R41_08395 [Paludibacteraceae bacterium]|nr:hypothetical protein [Paludibacteraceae bacterium]